MHLSSIKSYHNVPFPQAKQGDPRWQDFHQDTDIGVFLFHEALPKDVDEEFQKHPVFYASLKKWMEDTDSQEMMLSMDAGGLCYIFRASSHTCPELMLDLGGRVSTRLKKTFPRHNVHVAATHKDLAYYGMFGILLGSHSIKRYAGKASAPKEEKEYILHDDSIEEKNIRAMNQQVAAALYAQDLIVAPPNHLLPFMFAEHAQSLAQQTGFECTVLRKQDLERMGAGGLLGVSQGSDYDPFMLHLTWKGASYDHVDYALVGKGVTFDSGGLSLKSPVNMEDMKTDMAGAAVTLSAIAMLADAKSNINVSAVIALTENTVSGTAQRPGDVIKTLSGQTVEVLNTDAEGRLILCDALTYACREIKAKKILDFATLTGAIHIALGDVYAGLFTPDDVLAKEITQAGGRVGERAWRLPLDSRYDAMMDSPIADMQNIQEKNGGAGSITAAQFLQRFIEGDVQWAHFDIASVSRPSPKRRGYVPHGYYAFGIRLLYSLLNHHEA